MQTLEQTLLDAGVREADVESIARYVRESDWLDHAAQVARDEGEDYGYEIGYDRGYDTGYHDGRSDGHVEGYNDAMEERD